LKQRDTNAQNVLKKLVSNQFTLTTKYMREKIVRAVAGTFVLTSITLSQLVNPYWLLLAAFVGINLLQSSITGFCPLEKVLDRVGITR
jgi:hypothetical protein